MIRRLFRRQPPMFPFTVTALKQGCDPIRIGMIASDDTDALLTAQEMFPSHVIGVRQFQCQPDRIA